MANYSIDDKAVNDCALEFERVNGLVKGKHKECDDEVQNTIWDGETAKNFKGQAQVWLDKMNKITDELLFMQGVLNSNSNRAVDTDHHNAEIATKSFVN